MGGARSWAVCVAGDRKGKPALPQIVWPVVRHPYAQYAEGTKMLDQSPTTEVWWRGQPGHDGSVVATGGSSRVDRGPPAAGAGTRRLEHAPVVGGEVSTSRPHSPPSGGSSESGGLHVGATRVGEKGESAPEALVGGEHETPKIRAGRSRGTCHDRHRSLRSSARRPRRGEPTNTRLPRWCAVLPPRRGDEARGRCPLDQALQKAPSDGARSVVDLTAPLRAGDQSRRGADLSIGRDDAPKVRCSTW